jgi:syntaxin-binding protein 1
MTELTIGGLQWKVLVVDETSRKLIDNTVNEDDILNLNVTRKPTFLTA